MKKFLYIHRPGASVKPCILDLSPEDQAYLTGVKTQDLEELATMFGPLVARLLKAAALALDELPKAGL
jgi:hypothetical protein